MGRQQDSVRPQANCLIAGALQRFIRFAIDESNRYVVSDRYSKRAIRLEDQAGDAARNNKHELSPKG